MEVVPVNIYPEIISLSFFYLFRLKIYLDGKMNFMATQKSVLKSFILQKLKITCCIGYRVRN